VLDIAGVAIHGQSFAARAVRDDLAAGYPPASRGLFNIGILHTAATGRPGHEPYAPCCVEELVAKNYEYWALGHVHNREILCSNPWIVFPGNIQGRHMKETGPRGCTLVTVEDGGCSAEHRELDVVTWTICDVDISASESTDDVLDRTRVRLEDEAKRSDGRLLAARVELCGSTATHMDLFRDPERWTNEIRAVAADLGSGSVWIEQVRIRTRPLMDIEERLAQDDPLADLLRLVGDVQPGSEVLNALQEELRVLRTKLPPELVEEIPAFNLAAPEAARELLEEARETLTIRLLSEGGVR
jgi:DNA repair exonuclease SbcCD nuclease subunit